MRWNDTILLRIQVSEVFFQFQHRFIFFKECNCTNEKMKNVIFSSGNAKWCGRVVAGENENEKKNSQPISDKSTAVRNIVYKAASRRTERNVSQSMR